MTERPISRTGMAIFLSVVGHIIFGFSFLFTSQALNWTTVPVLLMWRFILATALLGLLALLKVQRLHLRRKGVGALLLMSLMEPVAYFLCENYGMAYSNTTFAAVMIALIPVASLLFGAIFLREHPSLKAVICSLVSVGGVVYMSLLGAEQGAVQPLGVALMIGAVLTALFFTLISRRTSQQFTPFDRTFVMMAVGTVFFTALALALNRHDLSALIVPFRQPQFRVSLVYLGILSSVGAYFCIHFASTYLPLARTTAFANLTTVVSVFAGAVFLDEYLGWQSILAAIAIIGGLWALQKATIHQETVRAGRSPEDRAADKEQKVAKHDGM